MSPDDPITLAEACRLYPGSRFKTATLKSAAEKGLLVIFRLGRSLHTTKASMDEWVRKCQDAGRRRGSISTEPGISGLSETERASIALDALEQIEQELKRSSPPTSPRSTRRNVGVIH
jgi:hypothetical protein